MQMIDVMKRLAELDATNPNVIKESQVQECGPMGVMDSGMHGMMAEKPSTPANFSINATASNGAEVADMMSQILTLAGMKKVGADDLGAEPQGAVVTAEPVSAVGPMAAEPMSAVDSMKSVLDKLHPETSDDEGSAEQDSEEDSEDDQEETDETFDNAPADPTDTPAFDSNAEAHQENQPGSGNDDEGKKRQSNLPTATFENLMKEYKQFIGESEDEQEQEESVEESAEEECSDCHKNPCECTDESTNESADILKLAGLK